MQPTPGRIVRYKLGADDVALIVRARSRSVDGLVIEHGNPVQEGDEYPAIIVRVNGAGPSVQLQVFLDGNDTHWATSRIEGDGSGQWAWPTRQNG